MEDHYKSAYECLVDDIEFMNGAQYALSEREYETMKKLLDITIHLHAQMQKRKNAGS
jgi:hypothetical protein